MTVLEPHPILLTFQVIENKNVGIFFLFNKTVNYKSISFKLLHIIFKHCKVLKNDLNCILAKHVIKTKAGNV
jgi:hypothetical protein